jgi:hypothetical protein
MASVARAVTKIPSQRRLSDIIRIQAGHMLTFDDLATREDITERTVLRKAIRKAIHKSHALMQLPLALAMFMAFSCSGLLHEDITNEFLVESNFRMMTDRVFGDVHTIEDWWNAVLNEEGLMGWLFKQTDQYGGPLVSSSEADPLFGNWGRIAMYNQVQAAVRFETTRPTTQLFGAHDSYCADDFECSVCTGKLDNGFFSLGEVKDGIKENLTHMCHGPEDDSGRRLRRGDNTIRAFLPQEAAKEDDLFVFHLYPSEPKDKMIARLKYYRDRKWLDEETDTVKIAMYCLNSELGRPRLEQLTIQFYFSESGEIKYERALLPIFLKFWQSGMFGKLSMAADASFAFTLVLTVALVLTRMWAAFAKSSLIDHVLQLSTAFEITSLLIGCYCLMNLWALREEGSKVTEVLTEMRDFGLRYPPTSQMQSANEQFWRQARLSATRFESVGLLWAWYTLLLQFRFFASFGAQPRLALVTNTISAVIVDLVHFLIVLFPTFLTYAFAGMLLFGRRMVAFATLPQALMTCFRIMIETEYPWSDLAAEYYVTAGIWSWTFMMVVAILMINMVLAIILDVYNEVHEHAANSETVWATMGQFYSRCINARHWVRLNKLKEGVDKGIPHTTCFIEMQDIRNEFPNIPHIELEVLFGQCRKDMEFEASKNLDKQNMVRLMGTVMITADEARDVMKKIHDEDDPLSSWVTPRVISPEADAQSEALQGLGRNFLTSCLQTKGSRAVRLEKPCDASQEEKPTGPKEALETWTGEIEALLSEQNRRLEQASAQMHGLHWKLQMAHLNKSEGAVSSPPAAPDHAEPLVSYRSI